MIQLQKTRFKKHEIIESTNSCCLTGSHQALVVATTDRTGAPLRTVISTESGLVFSDPRPVSADVRKFYVNDYRKIYKNSFVPKKKHILRSGRVAVGRYEWIRPHLTQNAKILDIGSGGGEFVYVCQRNGHRSQGVEPNRAYADFSVREYGVDIFAGMHQDIQYDKESFDCITLFHVLEHLESPVDALSQLSEYLRPGGILVIEVPNVDNTLDVPYQKWHVGHLFNFNARTLTATAAKAGLKVVELTEAGVLYSIFKKPSRPRKADINEILTGSFDTTYGILINQTTIKHYYNFMVPLTRLGNRFKKHVEEIFLACRFSCPVQILDSVLASRIK